MDLFIFHRQKINLEPKNITVILFGDHKHVLNCICIDISIGRSIIFGVVLDLILVLVHLFFNVVLKFVVNNLLVPLYKYRY